MDIVPVSEKYPSSPASVGVSGTLMLRVESMLLLVP